MAVSIDGAAPPGPWRQKSNAATISSSRASPGYTSTSDAQPVEAKNGEAGFGERAEVAAGTLHPQQLDVLAGDRVDVDPLRRRVAARVVGVAAVRTEPVRPSE